jgi:hypothetical protein
MDIDKELRDEQMGAEFTQDDPLEVVCVDCIADAALKCPVLAPAAGHTLFPIPRCDFCGSEGISGTSLEELFAHMATCLATEWEDPVHHAGWEGGVDPSVEILNTTA